MADYPDAENSESPVPPPRSAAARPQFAAPETGRGKGFVKGCAIGCAAAAGMVALLLLAIGGCSAMCLRSMGDKVVSEKENLQFRHVAGDRENGAKVLRIRLDGVIMSAEARQLFEMKEDTSAAGALKKLRRARKDRRIRGLYLCLDTPGGGVTASDEIWHAIRRFKAADTNRFVTVLMGDLCCSGGYYIASAADWVVARPTTITGSIGVIMNGVNAAGLAEKVGVKSVNIASAENKALLDPLAPVNPEHVEILRRPISQMYDRFVKIVAEGRKIPEPDVRKLADGRIYSADDALKLKLVDAIGYAEDAEREIRKRVGSSIEIVEYASGSLAQLLDGGLSVRGLAHGVRAAAEEAATSRMEMRMR